jgi:Ca-activated chloride channel family protein
MKVLMRIFPRYRLPAWLSLLLLGLYQANAFSLKSSISKILWARKAAEAYQQQNYGEAGIFYLDAAAQGPPARDLTYDVANAYYRQGRYAEAGRLYRQISGLESCALTASAWNNLGNCLYMQGNREGGLAAFKQALLLDAGNETARRNFLFLYLEFQQSIKTERKKPSPENDHVHGGHEQQDPSAQKNQKGEQPDDPSAGPYSVSDEQMFRLLQISKQQERVPGGLKSKLKNEKRSDPGQPDD